ncbi:7785_t:CDS:1, partial [Rhizophagus irregularis]
DGCVTFLAKLVGGISQGADKRKNYKVDIESKCQNEANIT